LYVEEDCSKVQKILTKIIFCVSKESNYYHGMILH